MFKASSSSRRNIKSHLSKKSNGETFNISTFCQNVFNRNVMRTYRIQIQYIIQHAYIIKNTEFSAQMDVEHKMGFT